ncbi:GNAT family N-acetyltransferase [Lacrimispora brassicae]
MNYKIREMQKGDWKQVSEIYQQGMDTNLATFQTKCPTYEEFEQSHMKQCCFVITHGDVIAGWAALTPVSSRCVYRGVAEVSIYIHDTHRGKGAGSQLLNFLSERSEKDGIWTLQSGIMADNKASIRLHEKCGFRQVGFRERIGKDRFGQWRNTVLMERRSNLI